MTAPIILAAALTTVAVAAHYATPRPRRITRAARPGPWLIRWRARRADLWQGLTARTTGGTTAGPDVWHNLSRRILRDQIARNADLYVARYDWAALNQQLDGDQGSDR